jgi:hypothetical protein
MNPTRIGLVILVIAASSRSSQVSPRFPWWARRPRQRRRLAPGVERNDLPCR